MIWLSEILGVLECGCQIDARRMLVARCSAHRGKGGVRLEQFSLDQAAEVRRLKADLASKGAALRRAQADRAHLHLKLSGETRKRAEE